MVALNKNGAFLRVLYNTLRLLYWALIGLFVDRMIYVYDGQAIIAAQFAPSEI